MNELIKITGLSVDFNVGDGELSAVKVVSFSIHKGQVYALVGESGCGKSTTAFALTRLLDPSTSRMTGSIKLDGQELMDFTDARMEGVRGKRIGMIFQNPLDSLNPVYRSGMQVSEAITLDKVSRKEAWERVINLYQQVQIPDSASRVLSFPHELSGGMRQRVMIAMMLSRQPDLLIADEPTTALDVTIEAQILDIMKTLKDTYGTAVLVITHNFGIVAEIADRIGVMYAGEIIEEADVFSIFDNPRHPYTKVLLRALPRFSKHAGRLETIDGVVPRVLSGFKGCRFANRCALREDICEAESPPLIDFGGGHTVRCHSKVI